MGARAARSMARTSGSVQIAQYTDFRMQSRIGFGIFDSAVCTDEPPGSPGNGRGRGAAGGSGLGADRCSGWAGPRSLAQQHDSVCTFACLVVTSRDCAFIVPRVTLGYPRSMREFGSGRYLTLAEVSRRTGLEQSWLRRLCQRGDLHAIKAGRDWLVTARDLAAFERDHKGRPAKS